MTLPRLRRITRWTAALLALVGATLGGVFGYLADQYAAPSRVLFPAASSSDAGANRFFPSRPTGRLGVAASQLTFQSPLVDGTSMGPAVSVVWQVSPYVSAHSEYARASGRFGASAPGPFAVPSFGIESRRVKYVFSNLVGFHPPPFGRFRVELLAGVGVQAQEDRHQSRNFETPRTGAVLGIDGEVALVPGFSIVPSFRYNRMRAPDTTRTIGIGAHWRF